MCTCLAQINAKLKPSNGRLATGFTVPDMHTHILIQVEKIAPRGKRPPLVLPTFCPFCGEKLEPEAA